MRAWGAEVVTGDLTRPETVAAALDGVRRTYFGLSVSPDHLLAATVMATVAKAHGELDVLVDMSQMTVSQMTATSTAESHQQRLHWLAEQVLDWSGLPVVHVRPTTFLDNPLFTALTARSIRENGTLALTGLHTVRVPVDGPHGSRIVITSRAHRPVLTDARLWDAEGLRELWQHLRLSRPPRPVRPAHRARLHRVHRPDSEPALPPVTDPRPVAQAALSRAAKEDRIRQRRHHPRQPPAV